MRRIFLITQVLLLAVALLLAAAPPAIASVERPPISIPLMAGKDMQVGRVIVGNDGEEWIKVKYKLSEDWLLKETHLHVTDDADKIPTTKKGNPIPGHFVKNDEWDPPKPETVYKFPMEKWPVGTLLFIAAHAVVVQIEDDEVIREETAWGGFPDAPVGPPPDTDPEEWERPFVWRFVERGNWATYFARLVGPQLSADEGASAVWTDEEAKTGSHSYKLDVSGALPAGTEARLQIGLRQFELGQINLISWWEYLDTGYPPHVDIFLDVNENGEWDGYAGGDEKLIFEYAYNGHLAEGWPTYGAETGDWYPTFNDDGLGPNQVEEDALGWAGSGPAGGPDQVLETLGNWQSPSGVTYNTGYGERTIDEHTSILWVQIEVDNWLAPTLAYVDDIVIDMEILP